MNHIDIDFGVEGHILTIVETDLANVAKILDVLEVPMAAVPKLGFNEGWYNKLKELRKSNDE